nr:MAG TPA: hypothetical protein [Bacteriophage sp.]
MLLSASWRLQSHTGYSPSLCWLVIFIQGSLSILIVLISGLIYFFFIVYKMFN